MVFIHEDDTPTTALDEVHQVISALLKRDLLLGHEEIIQALEMYLKRPGEKGEDSFAWDPEEFETPGLYATFSYKRWWYELVFHEDNATPYKRAIEWVVVDLLIDKRGIVLGPEKIFQMVKSICEKNYPGFPFDFDHARSLISKYSHIIRLVKHLNTKIKEDSPPYSLMCTLKPKASPREEHKKPLGGVHQRLLKNPALMVWDSSSYLKLCHTRQRKWLGPR